MNILTNNLKATFASAFLPAMCPSQKMQFHHSTSPLNLIENNALSAQNVKSFKNPNIFNQNTHGETIPSSYNKTNHFEVRQDDELEKSTNFSEMVPKELQERGTSGEVVPGSPKSGVSSRKRARKGKHKQKLPEKHNTNRQVVNELMDLDMCSDSTDISLNVSTEDQEMEESMLNPLKLCDLIVLPDHSSPLGLPIVDISMESSKPLAQTTCFAFSITPPNIRQRQLSTTESEDSFIVFDSGTDEECDFSEDAGSESDEDSELESDNESDTDSPGSVVPTKKVRFADDKELCEIHPMVQWSFAYQAARKGPWEVYARDRERFKNRIRLVGEKIAHCFEPEHRQKLYDQRFQNQTDG